MPQYDYIIAGAGCAGLSLITRIIRSGMFKGKKILLVDRIRKNTNDRTWCFWEKGDGFFEPLVYKKWKAIRFYGKDYEGLYDLEPYTYKMIRGIDFYKYCMEELAGHPNISVRYGEIDDIHSDEAATFIKVGGEKITATYIFSSILTQQPVLKANQFYWLQHFKGWVIETTKPVFDPALATLMDFRIAQQYGTSFIYVMPFSTTTALVEYTLFSETELTSEQYDDGLKNYIKEQLKVDQYTIHEVESGVIPMTNYQFPGPQHHIIPIGTAGGRTKPSSGYTFQFIQKQEMEIVRSLAETGKPFSSSPRKKFRYYDSVLLNVLATGKMAGDEIFTQLFSKNKITSIFPFLDNESSLIQDLKIISSLPLQPFLKAGLEEL